MSGERRGGVLAIAASGVLGGAERVLLDWLCAVAAPVTLACPPGALADAAADAGLAVAPLAERPLTLRGRRAAAVRDLAALRADVARLARGHRPAVVVASGQRPLLAAGWAPLGGAALIALVHDMAPGGAATAAALRAAVAPADAVVATSGAIARAADPGARRLGRTEVIHPGVDPARWADVPAPPAARRARCAWARSSPGSAPTSRWRSRPASPSSSSTSRARRCPATRPASPPGCASGPPAPTSPGASACSATPDPRAALADAHLLLHCADAEPFGLALVEALAAGRPVAAPAAGGPLEIVTPETGRLFIPGDPAAGAAAVRALLAAPPPAAAARARAARFDGDAAARRFAAVVARHLD